MEKILIYGDSLKYGQNNIVNIEMNISRKTIIRGKVYSNKCKAYADTLVQLIEKNPFTNKNRVLGLVTTDYNGEYYFIVNPNYYMLYEINIFPKISEGARYDYR